MTQSVAADGWGEGSSCEAQEDLLAEDVEPDVVAGLDALWSEDEFTALEQALGCVREDDPGPWP